MTVRFEIIQEERNTVKKKARDFLDGTDMPTKEDIKAYGKLAVALHTSTDAFGTRFKPEERIKLIENFKRLKQKIEDNYFRGNEKLQTDIHELALAERIINQAATMVLEDESKPETVRSV